MVKQFDINSPSNGMPIAEATELAGVSDDGNQTEKRDPDKAVQVFPVRFDKGSTKDFRPQEVIESELVPKDSSALAYASEGRSSSISPTGLEDVSQEDLLDQNGPPTTVQLPAETAS